MELRQLDYFARISALRSFSRAAAALNLTEPTLSEQIRNLEREIGVALFDRSRRPVGLTLAGELLERHTRAVFTELHQFQSELSALNGSNEGHINVGGVNSAGPLIPEVLADFGRRFPSIRTTLREEVQPDLLPLMRAGELDACLLLIQHGTSLPSGPFDIHRLFAFQMVFAVPVTHPLAGRVDVSVAELQHERFILGIGMQAQLVRDALLSAGFQPNVAFETNKSDMTVALVAQGAGIGLAPDFRVRNAHPGLSTFSVAGIDLEYEIVLIWNPRSRNELALSAFVNVVLAHDWAAQGMSSTL